MKAISLLLVLLMVVPALADEAFEAEFDASIMRVTARYPAAADPGSEFAARMVELFHEWQAAGDARAAGPQGPELGAETVAADFAARERRKQAARAKQAAQARPAAPIVTAPCSSTPARHWWVREKDDTVISAGPPPSSATVYGADGSISRVFSTGTGSATVYGPAGVTRIFPK
jgi:hypothetical protein